MANKLLKKSDEELMEQFHVIFNQNPWWRDTDTTEAKFMYVNTKALEIQWGGYPISVSDVRHAYDNLCKKGLLARRLNTEGQHCIAYTLPVLPEGCVVHGDYFIRQKQN